MTTLTSHHPGRSHPDRAAIPTDDDIVAARQLSRQWGWLLAGGIISMLAGIAVLSIRWNIDRLAVVTGLVFAVRGITEIATNGSRPHRGGAIFSGIVGLIVAVIAFSWPGPTLFVLATLTGIWLIMSGIFTVVGALFVRGPLWGLWLIIGLVAVPLGGWALGHPGATLAVMVAVVGLWAIAGGLMEIVTAFELRRLPESLQALQRNAMYPSAATGEAAAPTAATKTNADASTKTDAKSDVSTKTDADAKTDAEVGASSEVGAGTHRTALSPIGRNTRPAPAS